MAERTWTVYLSGEIHSDWREQIENGCSSKSLPVDIVAPNTNHEASDDCGVDILGQEDNEFWKDHKGAQVNAIDISPRALEIAQLNAGRHGVSDRLHFMQGDLLDPLTSRVDLITANLPYVMSNEIPTLDPEVRLYEPREALDGGDDGLDLIRRLLADAPAHLTDGGALLLEMDPRQIESAKRSASAAFPRASVRVVQDLARRDRVLVIDT